jgi:GNAT superfamily N-acetyltransferase
MTEISEVEPADQEGLRGFLDVEHAAQRADRPYAVLRSAAQLLQLVQRPSRYYRRTLLVAREAGRVVGTAELGLTQEDNLHLADLEICVLPEARRRGTGRALHDEAVRRARSAGRTTFLGEAYQPGRDRESPATAFARALGFHAAHREDHQVLDLPLPAESLDVLQVAVAGYEMVTWGNRAPDDLVEAYAAMHTQMGQDVPTGDLDHQPVTVDVARVRAGEERTAESLDQVVAAARRISDGVFGGYTLVYLPHDSDVVIQDDTMVMPGHRGHGLGLMLKSTVLRILHEEHPGRRSVHTWNAVENAPMQRINRALGFKPVELLLEMQRTDVGA